MADRFTAWETEVQATRRERLRQIIDDRFGGRLVDAGKVLGRAPTQIGSLLKERRKIGEEIARDFEARLRLPFGWLDSRLILDTTTAPREVRERIEALTEAAAAGRLDWGAYMAALDVALAMANASRPQGDH